MKKILVLICFGLFLFSCKKKTNCHCTTTLIYTSGQSFYSSKTEEVSEKLNKKQAKAVCDDEAKNINATYTNIFANNGSSSTGTTARTNCVIE